MGRQLTPSEKESIARSLNARGYVVSFGDDKTIISKGQWTKQYSNEAILQFVRGQRPDIELP